MNRKQKKLYQLILGIVMFALLPGLAQAHIKWFAAYDTLEQPLGFLTVLSPLFLILLSIASVCLFFYYWADRILFNRPISRKIDAVFANQQYLIPFVLRIFIGTLLSLLWYQGHAILTPELYTPSTAISWWQLLMAGFLFWRRTTWLTGIGLLVLYGLGIYHYNYFHMLDYMLFIGFGIYFILYSCPHKRLHEIGFRILVTLFALSIMWVAIGKFLYVDWYLLTIFQHPDIHFGLSLRLFLSCAGFIEFTFGFLLLITLFANRIAVFVLFLIFSLAIIKFGKIDLFGHMSFFAVFISLMIYGHSPIKSMLYQKTTGLPLRALRFLLIYYVVFAVFFGLYYLNQHVVAKNNYSHHIIEKPVVVDMYSVSQNGFGEKLGTITLEPRLRGVLFVPQLKNLLPGLHEVRIIDTPNCGIDGKYNSVFQLISNSYRMRAEPHSFYYDIIEGENIPDILVNKKGNAMVPFNSYSNWIRTLEGKSVMIYENDLLAKDQHNTAQRFICGKIGFVKWAKEAFAKPPATRNYED